MVGKELPVRLRVLIENPMALLSAAVNGGPEYTEEDWERIYLELRNRRLTDRHRDILLGAQIEHGKWKMRAVGQQMARYATIGKGWTTVGWSVPEQVILAQCAGDDR